MNNARPTAGKIVIAALLVVVTIFAGVIFGAWIGPQLYGQTMRVIPLEVSDAKLAKDSYEAAKAAEQRWEQVDQFVKKKYGSPGSHNDVEGMEYSEDFRYLVKTGVSGSGTIVGQAPAWRDLSLGDLPPTSGSVKVRQECGVLESSEFKIAGCCVASDGNRKVTVPCPMAN